MPQVAKQRICGITVDKTGKDTVMANKEVENLIQSAKAHYDAEEYDAAIVDYTKAIDIAPNRLTAAIYLERGLMHSKKGWSDHMEEFDLAFSDYQQASTLEPNDEEIEKTVIDYSSETFDSRGLAYYEQKNYDSAVEDLKQSKKLLENPLFPPNLAAIRIHIVLKLLVRILNEKSEHLYQIADKAEEKWREFAGDDWEDTDDLNDFETNDAPYLGDDYNSNTIEEETSTVEPSQNKTRGTMQILDNMNYPWGSVDENGTILDNMNYPKGRIGADGTIYDIMNYPKGSIGADGTIYDIMNYPKGRIDDNGTILDNMNYPKGSVK